MRSPFFIALLSAGLAANFSSARGIDNIVNALAAMPGYAASVEYAVTLPQAEEDVVYTVELSQPGSADSYLIDWNVMSPSGPVAGFTAWFDGHFYNFRNRRLQEHHEQWDATAPKGAKAVQNSAQFASLLPSRIAMQLREIASARDYKYKVSSNSDNVTVEAVRQTAGEPDAELTWRFRASDLRPLEFYGDYNPGAISGQQVKATYRYADNSGNIAPEVLSEEVLRERYPDAFTRFRESQFAIENMRGERLPAFSLPRTDGGRLTRRDIDPFDYPTIVALIDPESPLAPELVDALRSSLARVPFAANLLWASTGKNPDTTSELLGQTPPEEVAVTSAATLSVDCGAAVLPVIMICDREGKISDLIVGMNNNIESDVIQMLTKASPH